MPNPRSLPVLTDQQKIDAVARWMNGENHSAIARSLGCSSQNISILVRRRVNGTYRKKMDDQQKIDAVARYLDGESQYAIAKSYGVSYQSVRALLLRRGVTLRTPARHSVKASGLDREVFGQRSLET